MNTTRAFGGTRLRLDQTARIGAATNERLAGGLQPPHLYRMLTVEGAALIAEVIAAAWLMIALAGFSVRHSAPWLVFSAVAAALLLTSVDVVIGASST
jgi:hypothetical protein